MEEALNTKHLSCAHCGDDCPDDRITIDENHFCCDGCKMVFQILSDKDLCEYYDIEALPGISPKGYFKGRFGFLDDPEIEERILRYKDEKISMVDFRIPQIHCSSCIWLLENLDRIESSVIAAEVNFPKKKIRIRFKNQENSLGGIADLLASLGYEPDVNLGDLENERIRPDRALIYQIGVAGFCFGNIMLFALPEYFALEGFWIEKFGPFFRWLSLGLSLPVILYSARPYFVSARKGLQRRFVSIDVPIAIGMFVLFTRSAYEVLTATGTGYFDSLAGLVFFLLLGKLFQSRTYAHLNFERDYKAYFPVAVNRLEDGKEVSVAVNLLEEGDEIYVRFGELIPCDATLLEGEAWIDNSFVTGESKPLEKSKGEKIFAGGRQMGGRIRLQVKRTVSQSYLTQLWNHTAFQNESAQGFKNLTDRVSKYFTLLIMLIALGAGLYWMRIDMGIAAQVVTAVLIVACPCALALSAPFALGNMSRLFGLLGFYVKKPEVIEKIAQVNAFALDKTGTITLGQESEIDFHGVPLSDDQNSALKSLFGQSNHPLSRWMDRYLEAEHKKVIEYKEWPGKGISGHVDGVEWKAGSASFIGVDQISYSGSSILISENGHYLGYFEIKNRFRPDLKRVFSELQFFGPAQVLTGDTEAEKSNLEAILGEEARLHFKLKPEDKLHFIEDLQREGQNVLMLGDGLNDAGALKQSNVGISISEDINSFTPGSDGILDAKQFGLLPKFILWSRKTKTIILFSFGISFAYNIIGLSFAVTGKLSPVVAAILMPISSVTVVAFVTIATNFLLRKEKRM